MQLLAVPFVSKYTVVENVGKIFFCSLKSGCMRKVSQARRAIMKSKNMQKTLKLLRHNRLCYVYNFVS